MLNTCFENIQRFLESSELDFFDKIYIVGKNQEVIEVSKRGKQIIDEMKNQEEENKGSCIQNLERLYEIKRLLIKYCNLINPVLNPIINGHIEQIEILSRK